MVPSKEQLVKIIAEGDNSINNSLVITIDGVFELRDFDSAKSNVNNDLVGRFETLGANNVDIGIEAAQDRHFISMIYTALLECWYYFNLSGAKDIYMDSESQFSEDELLEKLNQLVEK